MSYTPTAFTDPTNPVGSDAGVGFVVGLPSDAAGQAKGAPAAYPLFVDLDGTLVASDLLAESLLRSLNEVPQALRLLPALAFRGRAAMKRLLAEHIAPDAATLPYRPEVLAFLRQAKARGTAIVLATASDRLLAEQIAAHLGLFDDVLASDGQTNLKGAAKLEAIRAYCHAHGYHDFAYLGDSAADLPIWREAAQAYAAAPSPRVSRSLQHLERLWGVVVQRPARWPSLLRVLRPHQWAKNLLLLAPLILAHQVTAVGPWLQAILAMMAFSACASAVYVANDLIDIEADRHHPSKQHRPFASGKLPLAWGPLLIVGLCSFAFGLAGTMLPLGFVGALCVYLVLSSLYCFWLKRKVLLDVFTLAGLYTLRLLAGGMATHTPISEWLLALSVFLFTSLALAKRCTELSRLADEGHHVARGRGYRAADCSLLESMGATTGCLSVLVLALYLNSEVVKRLYPQPWAMWLICPLLLYWISRLWLLTRRREISEDPVVFAVSDRVSLLTGVVAVALLIVAAWPT